MTDSTAKEEFLESQADHYRQTLKEARTVVVIWFIGLIWCATTIIGLGYPSSDERRDEPSLVWGVPAWVFWGLFVPWIAQIALTWWFAVICLKDDAPYMELTDTES